MASHRWVFLLPLSLIFFVMLVITWPTVRWASEWWEFGMEVPTQTATPAVSSQLPPVTILENAIVAFESLRFGRDDRDLDALVLRLRTLAPTIGPNNVLQIHPSPESRYERIVEVLSAVRRAGIRHYNLL